MLFLLFLLFPRPGHLGWPLPAMLGLGQTWWVIADHCQFELEFLVGHFYWKLWLSTLAGNLCWTLYLETLVGHLSWKSRLEIWNWIHILNFGIWNFLKSFEILSCISHPFSESLGFRILKFRNLSFWDHLLFFPYISECLF